MGSARLPRVGVGGRGLASPLVPEERAFCSRYDGVKVSGCASGDPFAGGSLQDGPSQPSAPTQAVEETKVTSWRQTPVMQRPLVIGSIVLLLHVALLWALQSGLMRRAAEVVVPVQILSGLFSPPAPEAPPPPPPRQVQSRPRPTPPPVMPVVSDPEPLPMPEPTHEPVEVSEPVSSEPVAPAPVAPPAPKIVLPTNQASYLNNPPASYPTLSRRLGEQGRVVVRVLIGVDGRAQQAEVKLSSGYARLDKAALAAVSSWRYAPGTRGGVPEAMWHEVPVNYVLQ